MRGEPVRKKLTLPKATIPTPVELLLDILAHVDREVRKEPKHGQECLPRYWQGKKDGIRIAMIILNDESNGDMKDVKQLQMTSRVSRYTAGEEDVLKTIFEDIHFQEEEE
jgi:hypothetical protein